MKNENEIKLADQLDFFAGKLQMHKDNLNFEMQQLKIFMDKYEKLRLDNITEMTADNKTIEQLLPDACYNLKFSLYWHTMKAKREEWGIEIYEQVHTQLLEINKKQYNGEVQACKATRNKVIKNTVAHNVFDMDIDDIASNARSVLGKVTHIDIFKIYNQEK